MHGSVIYFPYQDEYNKMLDCKYVEAISIRKCRVRTEEKFEAKILQGILPRNGDTSNTRFYQRSSICFKTKGTKKYLVEVLNATIK
jgi:hypothetical protein